MTLHGTGDPILEGLRGLPRAEPGAHSTARARARSHAILARQRQHRKGSMRGFAAGAIDGAVALLCVVYLSGAVAQALRLIDAIR
jgi:hypothetical protein